MSDELRAAVDELLEAVGAPAIALDVEAVQDRASEVLEAARDARPAAIEAAAVRLAGALDVEDAGAGAVLALALGALVEGGLLGPGPVGKPLLARAEQVLGAAVVFRERAEALVPPEVRERLEARGGCTHDHDHDHDHEDEDEDEWEDEEDADEDEHAHSHDHHDHGHGPGCGGHDHGHAHEHAWEEEEAGEGFLDEEQEDEDDDAVDAAFATAAAQSPAEAAAWDSVEQWCLPAIALLTRDEALRRAAQARPALLAACEALEEDGSHFLARLLRAPVELELVVLHPPTAQGYRVRARGVVDNFQLQVLLADALVREGEAGPADGLPGRRPAPEVVHTFRGQGEQECDHACHGLWNLYAWPALDAQGQLPATQDVSQWVWGEGTPGDIPAFEGTPVLLLGPQSYERSWPAARTFDALPAAVELLEVLAPAAVRDWLGRLARAPRPPEEELD